MIRIQTAITSRHLPTRAELLRKNCLLDFAFVLRDVLELQKQESPDSIMHHGLEMPYAEAIGP